MIKEVLRQGAVLVATGALLTGCMNESRPESEKREGAEFHHGVGEAPANEAADLGILPENLPYKNVELTGNIHDEEGTTVYHVVAQSERKGNDFIFAPHDELDDKTTEIFRAALSESEDLMSAAARRGVLDHVIFARGLPDDESTQSHYNQFGKVVAITIFEKGLSYDELVATLRHELWHAVTHGLNFTEQEWEGAYSEACNELDEHYTPNSLQYLGQIVSDLRTYLETKRASHPEEYSELADPLKSVAEYIGAGKGAEDIVFYCGQLSVGYSLGDLEKAALGLDEQASSVISSKLGGFVSGPDEIFGDMDRDSELYRAIGREFIEGDTVYADVSEFPYVKNSVKDKIFLGHAAEADNFAEIWASILNTATYYTDDFADRVAEMHPTERRFVLTFLGLTIKHTAELNPELSEYLNDTEQRILKRVVTKA